MLEDESYNFLFFFFFFLRMNNHFLKSIYHFLQKGLFIVKRRLMLVSSCWLCFVVPHLWDVSFSCFNLKIIGLDHMKRVTGIVKLLPSGKGIPCCGSVQPPVGFQRYFYAEFSHAYPSFSHASQPSIKMNIAAPNHHVEFGRAYPTSSHISQPSINILALNYYIPPWYQRSWFSL